MRNLGRKTGRKKWPEDRERYARFLLIPVAAIILVLLIIIADRPSEKDGQEPVAAQQGVEEHGMEGQGMEGQTAVGQTAAGQDAEGQSAKGQDAEGQSAAEPAAADGSGADDDAAGGVEIGSLELVQDGIPELTSLVLSYCHAREDGDPETLARIFGREAGSAEEQEAERAAMERVNRMVDGYENISCYHMAGPEPDTYVIYPYFEIRYQDAETAMPSLTWAYVVKGEDGQFYMTQDIGEAVKEYIAETGKTEAVKALISQVEAGKAEAIAADEALRQIYDGSAMAGGSQVEIVMPQ